MRGRRIALAWTLGILLAGACPALAVTNGALDGGAHPAIGLLLATNTEDICSGSHQFISDCSVTLIAPDLVLTTRTCAQTFAGGLSSGLVDQIWIILDPNPAGVAGAYDCNKFIDVDELEIVPNPGVANLGVLRLMDAQAIPPVMLPEENRLQTVPHGQGFLTAVTIGATSRATGGFDILQARRRFWPGRTSSPLEPQAHPVTLESGGSPAQACFGPFSSGGAIFEGESNNVVSMTRSFGSCPQSGDMIRLDTSEARDFLDGFVALP